MLMPILTSEGIENHRIDSRLISHCPILSIKDLTNRHSFPPPLLPCNPQKTSSPNPIFHTVRNALHPNRSSHLISSHTLLAKKRHKKKAIIIPTFSSLHATTPPVTLLIFETQPSPLISLQFSQDYLPYP